jgi:hypothetical protein
MTWYEIAAARLYTQRAAERGPPWDQLGEITRLVWIGYVLIGEEPDA